MSKRSTASSIRPARRSQEERSATTRALVLQAATKILSAEGYAAATVQLVASRAGVSRGAMLHHFPSKMDLMIAVVHAAHESDLTYLRAQLDKIATPLDRVKALPLLTWNVLSGPSGIAVLEIMMGSRSDPDLARMLEPVQSRIESESRKRIGQLMTDADLRVDAESMELVRVVVAAIRGLSIETMFRQGKRAIPAALQVFETLIETQLMPRDQPVTKTPRRSGSPR